MCLILFSAISARVFCQNKDDSAEELYDKTLQDNFVIVEGVRPHELNPQITSYASDSQLLTGLFEGLFSYNPKTLEPEYAIASDYKISRDKKRWTFTIRQDARYSNGEKITADSVRDSWLQLLGTKEAPYASLLDVIRNASEYRHGECTIEEVGIYALSDYVLTVHLVKPANYLPRVLCHTAFSVIHRNPTVYSGPFYLYDRDETTYILKKNPYYWDFVNTHLPYEFRTGVIKRSVLWKYDSDRKKFDFDGLSDETISSFRNIMKTGVNDKTKISRIKNFTANDFFKACELGYKALNYDTAEMSPSELYLKYADGRDEGLTGKGCGLNEGPGIDFNDAKAWDEWYYNKICGGHPWEIIRGGNSTHLDLYVSNDKTSLDIKLRLGEISEEEYKKRLEKAGYYFTLRGKYRQLEAVTFYTTLYAAGLPVILEDAEEILARFDGNDYVGIVPHSCFPRYCESMFPSEYGKVIDFMNVYDEEMEKFGKEISWLPEDEAKLK